jgi:hypothetical protein
LVSFLLKKEFFRNRSIVPAEFRFAFNFQQYPAFPSSYNPDDFSIVKQLSRAMGHFPFPDMTQFNPDIAQAIREWAEFPPCSHGRAVLIQGMRHEFCSRPLRDRIQSNFPPPMDQRLLDRIVDLTD